MTDGPIYTLQGNQTQMRTMQRAMELYARLGTGQLEEILHLPSVQRFQAEGMVTDAVAQKLLRFLKMELFNLHTEGADHAIGSDRLPDDVRVAWDIYATIRHRLAWDRAGNPPMRDIATMSTVDFDEVYAMSAQPLPTIAPIEREREPDVFFPTEIKIVAARGSDLMCIIAAYNPEITIDLTSLLQRSPPTDQLKPGDYLQPGTRFKAKVNLAAGISKLQLRDINYTADLYDDEEIQWAARKAETFLGAYADSSSLAITCLTQILIDCYRYKHTPADYEQLAMLLVERWLPLLQHAQPTIVALVELMTVTKRDGEIMRHDSD